MGRQKATAALQAARKGPLYIHGELHSFGLIANGKTGMSRRENFTSQHARFIELFGLE